MLKRAQWKPKKNEVNVWEHFQSTDLFTWSFEISVNILRIQNK